METKKSLEKSVLSIMGAWISNKFGLLLPALGILPAIGFLNVQIAEQQRGEVGGFRLRRLGAQALLCLEHIKQPFFQLADLRLDVAEQTVCRFDTAVQFAALGSDSFFLHL